MNVILKTIAVDDQKYQQFLELRDEVLRRPIGMSIYSDDLSNDKNEVIFIALSDDEVIGCLMLKPLASGVGKLRQMAVSSDSQGKGIGQKLMMTAEDFAKNNGFRLLELNARITAVPFYEKLGYLVEGSEFTEVGIPHLFMKKDLDEATV